MKSIMLLGAPPSWKVERIGQLFSERKEKVSDKDYPPLSVTMNGIVPQMEHVAKTDDSENRKRVCVGDIVINSRSDRKGASGLSEYDGSVSLISIVLEPRHGHPRFLHHMLKSQAFQEEFYRFGHGIHADLWTTRFSEMKGIYVALPDFETQKAIANFLDRETVRIDQLIEKKKRLISLLNEKRSSVIDRNITGVNNNYENLQLKKSNFFPYIPEGWTIERLRYSIRSIEQGWSPEAENRSVSNGEWGVLKVGCVNYGVFRVNEHKALPSRISPRPEYEVRDGDLLMSRGNSLDLVGSTAVAENIHIKLMLSDLLYRLHINPRRADKYFLCFALNSRPLRRQIELSASGSSDTMPKISKTKIRNLEWVRPPLNIQEKIAEQISQRPYPV